MFAFPIGVAADTAAPGGDGASASRPRIGLVLAGGGAKGGAHIGVLKVLEQQRVPIDCIAGTSMGALIGAGYAAGMPADEIERFVTGIKWDAVVGGAGRRPLEPIQQKRLATAASTPLELGISHGHIVAPGGLTNTSGIDDLLRTYVAQARTVVDFDQLPIPFRAVSTDMVSGRMVVLKSGDLATAMRASMAIPGAFAPVVGQGYILADGGMVRNIPVDVARDLCADVVIVVNLVEPETAPENLVQATQLLARSVDVMLQANELLQLQTLTDRDIRIDVPTGDIGTADFERTPETIPLGFTAAQAVAGRLAEFSLPADEYAAWRQHVTTHQEFETRVAAVSFEGLTRVNPEYLQSLTTIKAGDTVNVEAISVDAARMSAIQDLDSVGYRLDGDPANPTLVWLPSEVSVGPNVVRPSIGVHASGGGDLKFVLGAQHVRNWMNPRGGYWYNNLQVGYETKVTTGMYQPLDIAQHWFVEPQLFAVRAAEDLYFDEERIATYRFIDVGGQVDFGMNLGKVAQMRVGYLSTARRAEAQTGDPRLPEIDVQDAGLVFSAVYDSRNTPTFATSGVAARLDYLYSEDSLGADRSWERIEAGLRTAVPIGRNLAWISIAGGADLGDETIPGDRAFALGGPRTLPAYQLNELRVGSYWLADMNFLWRIKELVAVKDQVIYGGVGLQVAGLYDRIDLVEDSEVFGASLYLGGPTPIGTFTIGIGFAEDNTGIWLSLGRPIGNGSILDDGLFR